MGTLCCAQAQDLIERAKMGLKLPSDQHVTDHQKSGKEVRLFEYESNKSRQDIGAAHLRINKSKLHSLKKLRNNQIIHIPVSATEHVAVVVSPTSKLLPIVTDEKGQEIDVVHTHQMIGHVLDDKSSTVNIAISNNAMSALITDKHGNYNIGPKKGSKGEYVFFNDLKLGSQPFSCKNDEVAKIKRILKQKNLKSIASIDSTYQCIKIYIETDYLTYQNVGGGTSIQAVVDYVEGAFAQVATIYERIGIPMQLSEIKVWTEPDPYHADKSVGHALTYASSNVSSFNGDIFHLISAKNDESGYSGVGYVSSGYRTGLFNRTTLCGPNPFSVSQTQLGYETLPVYSWTVNVIAHEIGHNLGAPHTHECAWGENYDLPLDQCVANDCSGHSPGLPPAGQGTLMSYCHLNSEVGISLEKGFHPTVAEHIRSEYAKTACLTLCGPIPGCMDETSHSYNQQANIDDGTCEGYCDDGIQNGDETDVDCGGKLCLPCGFTCDAHHVIISLYFDKYPEESTWEIIDSRGMVIASSLSYSSEPDGSTKIEHLCLQSGDYTFVMKDSYRDGMCCKYGNGGFVVMSMEPEIKELANGGQFLSADSTEFTLSMPATCDDGIQNGTETGIDCGGESCKPCSPCDTTSLLIEEEMMILDSLTQVAKQTIKTSAKITVDHGASVMWQAGQEIEITGEFEIMAGSEMLLQVEDCIESDK